MEVRLVPHPEQAPTAVDEIVVAVERPSASELALRYTVRGRIGEIVLPPPAPPQRSGNLWETTCFEAFLRRSAASYVELNFSPSGQWAAYDFTAYRAGMVQLCLLAPPEIAVTGGAETLSVAVRLGLDLPGGDQALALAAVVEERSGAKTYWAVRHPAGAPDFHDPACFALRVPPPAPA